MLKKHDVVTIPDLQVGNLASVVNMIRKCGGSANIISHPEELKTADKVILAGVGAFDSSMRVICEGGWQEPLNEFALHRKKPILGICVGMQVMTRGSEEGVLPGLGWIDADVHRFKFPEDSDLKIPHMGWNTVFISNHNPLILQEGERFYFVHSYHSVCDKSEDILAYAQYGGEVTVAFGRDNILGVQFHPEKSHRFGMSLMKNFLDLSC